MVVQARAPSSDRTAREVATLLQYRDWAGLYNHASVRERDDLALSAEQFTDLMNEVGRDFHPTSVQVLGAPPLFKGSRSYSLRISNSVKDYDGLKPGDGTFAIKVRLNPDGSWTSDMWALPILINRFGPPNLRERMVRLKSGMEKAKIERLTDWLNGKFFTTETLASDIARNDGRMTWK